MTFRSALAACGIIVLAATAPLHATPTIQTLSNGYLVSNGLVSMTFNTTNGDITSIIFDGQQLVGSKGFYYDIQGSPNVYLDSAATWNYSSGSNYIDLSAEMPATASQPIDITWHWIIGDGQAGYSSYITYNHTTAMADWGSSENRLGAQFYNGDLFHYSSITDNFWGYQAAGDADRGEGRYITGETSDMQGIPSEYIKNYETKYDWRSNYEQSGGVTGIVTAVNDTPSTRPLVANDFGAWVIENPRSYEGWNAGPTHPQTPVADGASIIPSPPGSHFGGPTMVMTGNQVQTYGPIFNYFNVGTSLTELRNDAKQYASPTASGSYNLNSFYDSANLPYYDTISQRGAVTGDIRIADGQTMSGGTIVLSTFDPTAYASSPISQEYQRRATGYNYWISVNPDGTFTIPDVRPGNYRVTIIKPGNYREGTWDNITVTGGSTTIVGNLTWQPDISGAGQWQIGAFDRTAGEFHDGNNYNNWLGTFNETKEFPSGVNYTVNPANPFHDTTNWQANWPLYQENGTLDFFHVNFNLASIPAAGSTVTFTVSIAAQEFINSLGFSLNGGAQQYAGFDHTYDNAPSTYRSGDTSSRVLYRKVNFTVGANGALSFDGTSYGSLVLGNNSLQLHIVGGNMQYDALRMDIQAPGTFSLSQWNGGNGNWSDATQWGTQQYGYTSVNKGLATINGVANPEYGNDTSTTFSDGATQTAPINNSGSQLYYDAFINGGTVTLDVSPTVQKLSLLSGALNVASGTHTLTANDVVVLGGGTFSGSGTINALSTTTVNYANTISAGAKVNSTGPVSWIDGLASVTVTGGGSQWNTTGLTFGQSGASTLAISGGGLVSTGSGTLVVGPQGTVSLAGGTLATAGITNAGSIAGSASLVASAAGLVNSGTAAIAGGISGTSVTNLGGMLLLSGADTYTGATTITGGLAQFSAIGSIGGSGRSVTVNSGGAVSFVPGIANPLFLARLNPASQGSLALTVADSAATLNFTSGPLATFAGMSLGAAGNLTYSGVYTPSGGVYRLGGGSGVLTYAPLIAGAASLVIGNSGSGGTVIVSSSNSFTGPATINGGLLAVSALANGGANSALGSSTSAVANLVVNGGTLQAIGPATTDRLFTIGPAGATLGDAGGSFNWTNSGQLAAGGGGNRTMVLMGTSTANAFSPVIADPTSGVTSVTKDGPGTWTLNSASTYSGDTLVLSGTLKLGTSNALPSGSGKGNLVIAISGGVEMNGHNLSINALNDGPVPTGGTAGPNGNGGGTLTNSSGTNTLTLGNANASGLFSGVSGGGINLVKTGSGLQVLSGDNTYTGTTTISGGSLQVGVGGTPSSFGPGDGGFRGMLGSGNVINNATLVFNRGYYTTCSNVISGSGTLKQIANAELVLGTANTYTGPTLIGGGIANIGLGGPDDGTGLPYSGDCSLNAGVLANGGVASSIGASSSAAANVILDGGTLFYSNTSAAVATNRLFTVTQNGGAIWASGGLTFTNSGSIVMSGSGDRSLSLEGDTTTSCTFDCAIGDPLAGGQTTLVKDRSATWVIGPTSLLTYSGDTHLYMGKLTMGSGVKLPYGAGKGNVVFDTSTDFSSIYPATLNLGGNDENINGLEGGLSYYSFVTNTSGTHTFTLGNADATAEFDGVITGGINLVKVGSGTETFTAASTYNGSTTVSDGAVVFSGTGAFGGSGKNVTVANGALLAVPGSTANQTFLNRLVTASSGVLALTSSDASNLDFSSSGANLPNVSFGAVGAVTFSGTLTPAGTTYQLGGGGGTLTIATPLTGSGRSVVMGGIGGNGNSAGTVVLAASDTYGGSTTVSAGNLQFNSAASIGGSGASVFVASGAVAAAGYAMDQPFLSRIATSSSGIVALAANSANNLNFSSNGANLQSVTIGALGLATYTGLLTPSGSTYRFGGGGGTLVLGNSATLSGTDSVIVGLGTSSPSALANPLTLNVSAAQSYSGSTTIRAGGTVIGTVANGGLPSALGDSSNAASNLVFDGGTLIFTGNTDRLFTLTANGGTITTGGAYSFTNSGPIVLPTGASVTLTLNGSDTNHDQMDAAMANPSGGTLSVVKNGTGKWTFDVAGNKTYTGDTDILAGTFEELVSNAFSANSNVVISSGASVELHNNSAIINGLSGAGNLYDSFSSNSRTLTVGAAGGSGTFSGSIPNSPLLSIIKIGSGAQVFSGLNTNTGSTQVSGGTLAFTGGTTGANSADLQLSPNATDVSTTTLAATATLFAQRTIIAGNSGNTSGGTATFTQTGGTLHGSQGFTVGSEGNGVYNLQGGLLTVNGSGGTNFEVGKYGSASGTVNQSGGVIQLYNNANLQLGGYPGQNDGAGVDSGNGVYNQNGGSVIFYSDSGLTVGGSGVLALGDGLSRTGTYTYNLSGGTLNVPAITRHSGAGIFNFNGGLLRAAGGTAALVGGLSAAHVMAGGGTIDAGGNMVSITQSLLHDASGPALDGGLDFTDGTLILSGTNTYTGGTTIENGALILVGGDSLASGTSLTVGNSMELGSLELAAAGPGAPAASQAIPEPDTIVLALVAAMTGLFIARKRRH